MEQGIIGYDTGRRIIVDGAPEETRWIGGPIWIEIAIGLAALAYALFKHRQLRTLDVIEADPPPATSASAETLR